MCLRIALLGYTLVALGMALLALRWIGGTGQNFIIIVLVSTAIIGFLVAIEGGGKHDKKT